MNTYCILSLDKLLFSPKLRPQIFKRLWASHKSSWGDTHFREPHPTIMSDVRFSHPALFYFWELERYDLTTPGWARHTSISILSSKKEPNILFNSKLLLKLKITFFWSWQSPKLCCLVIKLPSFPKSGWSYTMIIISQRESWGWGCVWKGKCLCQVLEGSLGLLCREWIVGRGRGQKAAGGCLCCFVQE